MLLTQSSITVPVKQSLDEDEEFFDPVLPLCEEILQKLPEPFDVDDVSERYPIVYEDSMNTVLRQELIRLVFDSLAKMHKFSSMSLPL